MMGKVIVQWNTGVLEVAGEEKGVCWCFSFGSFRGVIYPSAILCPKKAMSWTMILGWLILLVPVGSADGRSPQYQKARNILFLEVAFLMLCSMLFSICCRRTWHFIGCCFYLLQSLPSATSSLSNWLMALFVSRDMNPLPLQTCPGRQLPFAVRSYVLCHLFFILLALPTPLYKCEIIFNYLLNV